MVSRYMPYLYTEVLCLFLLPSYFYQMLPYLGLLSISDQNSSHYHPVPVRYKHFERWAMGADFPLANIINNGSSLPDTQRGALADLQLVLDTKRLAAGRHEDVMVVAGDMMFQVR